MSEEIKPLKIFIGWDSREDIAYQVAKHSIEKHASVPVDIQPLKQRDLRKSGLYTRDVDKLASTEFTFTRFLIPELMEFDGWALFIDCDFVAVDDVAKLFAQADGRYAVMCAQHDYTPKEGIKMDGQVQTVYPRKNWSSMMLINCGHPSNAALVRNLVNNETKTGAFFHRFSWLKDEEVGKLSHEWNWLVGWYKEPDDGTPRFLHYTEGGPWFKQYRDCEYNYEWYEAQANYLEDQLESQKKKLKKELEKTITIKDLHLSKNFKSLLDLHYKKILDPKEHTYKTKEEIKKLTEERMGIKVAAIAPDAGDYNLEGKGLEYDPYLEGFIAGAGGKLSSFDLEKNSKDALVIRGLGGGSQKALKHCLETGRDFYAIDTGYMQPGTKKEYHRITKNALQNLGPVVDRDHDRLKLLNWNYKRPGKGEKILICPPSEKVMKFYGEDLDEWMKTTLDTIKTLTNKPIEIRLKPSRGERVTTNTIWQALDNAYCLVTYNSIAATEALLYSVPAITLAPNAASVLCNTSLNDINNLYLPTKREILDFAAHLSYCQFTQKEMANGYAWKILNEGS